MAAPSRVSSATGPRSSPELFFICSYRGGGCSLPLVGHRGPGHGCWHFFLCLVIHLLIVELLVCPIACLIAHLLLCLPIDALLARSSLFFLAGLH